MGISQVAWGQGFGGVERGRQAIQRDWQNQQKERQFWVFRGGQADLYQTDGERAMNMTTGEWGIVGGAGDVFQFGEGRDQVLNDLLMQGQGHGGE